MKFKPHLLPKLTLSPNTGLSVTAPDRQLRATWSARMADDLAAFHSIDAEAELTALLNQNVISEMRREMISILNRNQWQIITDNVMPNDEIEDLRGLSTDELTLRIDDFNCGLNIIIDDNEF